MAKNKSVKFIVSTWPSAGGTTLSLMLADLLNLKYIYAGGVLKEWARKMGYDPSSNQLHDWENKYGITWDLFWEKYIALKIANTDNILCEGKTAGFLLPAGEAFEIMVTASKEVRKQRAGTDQRSENIETRDNFLRERWLKLFQIDFFDRDLIEKNYDLLVDNSNLTISQTLALVFSTFFQSKYAANSGLTEDDFSVKLFKKYEQEFLIAQEAGNKGKEIIKNRLVDKNLIISTDAIFKEWRKDYTKMLKELPEEMQAVVY